MTAAVARTPWAALPRAPGRELPAAIRFACPRCAAELNGLQCPGCRIAYPAPDGIPWLFADPAAARAEWRNRYDHACRRLDADRVRTLQALQVATRESTRRRLAVMAAGQAGYHAEIDAILGRALGDGGAPLESHVAMRTGLPPSQGLFTYESNVFRDWCWGAAENAAALEEVRAVLGDRAPERILVLGSGAGRLAYDLHQAILGARTVALDLNPLLACIGHRVSRGETLSLTEFPLAPRRPEDVALVRTLAAPTSARPGITFVLGDATCAPFPPGSFDLVVTPWLLDILDEPASVLVSRVNALLAPDGCWINHGSVAFGHRDPTERLTLDELMTLAGEMGFEVAALRERDLPYLRSPASRHSRVENVVTFAARRVAPCAVLPRRPALPDWIAAGSTPIPALPEFRMQALATKTHAYVMALIDGERSLHDIARVMARHGLMDEAGARVALAGFFATMYEEATGRGGL